MPKATSIQKRDSGIGAAFDADQPRAPVKEIREGKTATMTQKIEPSLRLHFQLSAKKEGKSLTKVIVEELLKRYPLPDSVSYASDEEE